MDSINSSLKQEDEKIKIHDLESILRESQNDNQLQVIDLKTSNLVPTGENFASIMVKIEAKVRRGSSEKEEILHLVAKTIKPIETPFMIWTDVLRKEIFLYSKLMPMYKDLEKDAGVPENQLINCVPKYMGHRYTLKKDSNEVDDYSLLLMENIKAQGYYMGDRKKGLDMTHATAALITLARYHALGVVLREKRSDDFNTVKAEASIFGFVADEFDSGYDNVLKILQEEPSFTKYMPKIESSFAFLKKCKELPEPVEPWITIIHGDFWTNNLLFHKNDDGQIDSVKFVDFQIYLYTSPCRDLAYFLCCSLDQEFYDRIEELLGLYHEKFTDTLQIMGCDPSAFIRESFDKELKKQLIYGFPTFALCQKYFTYEVSEEEKKDIEIVKNVMNSECSEACKKKLIKLVGIYGEKGWF